MLDQEMISSINGRYDSRLKKYGDSPLTLGWDSLANQSERFRRSLVLGITSNSSIIDVGCGLAHYREYLDKSLPNNEISYIGVDINQGLLNLANRKFPQDHFACHDYSKNANSQLKAEFAVICGVFNLNLPNISNYDFLFEVVKNVFMSVDKGIYFDCLSIHKDKNYPPENFVFYFDPDEVSVRCREITKNIKFHFHEDPIPQNEFGLVLLHD